MPLVRSRGVNLLPIDSEHSAIFQSCMAGRSAAEVARIVLTASGGPFRTWPLDRLHDATVEETLNHPTWSMGPKVTVDSASLMNKALEVIEAHWLFDVPADRIQVVVHPQSVVHSLVEFVDGSVVAQLSPPDMKSPIQYALTWPDRAEGCSRTMDWHSALQLDFEPVDEQRFPALGLAYRVVETGGTSGAVLNAADEAAVEAFLQRRIPFGMIWQVVRDAMAAIEPSPVESLDDVHRADRLARQEVARLIAASPQRRATEAVRST
jgi:1-deoxy-D-xylulose-5-phosphate reductoisomerase